MSESTIDGSVKKTAKSALTIAALGVVFGDIGTSPIYALRECFSHGLAPTPDHVLQVISYIFWALIIIVSIQYVTFVLRADNKGEGGILALMTLISKNTNFKKRARTVLLLAGTLGAALIYSDGILTPAMSVLSAIEGVEVATPMFAKLIVPMAVVILFGLFVFQYRGTEKVGMLFGPVMLVWFTTLGIIGIFSIAKNPSILVAMNPYYAVQFLVVNKLASFAVLGSIFLALTGAEVLYADLGHFGRKPIQRAWFFIALPGLLLNYFGQGAYLLSPNAQVSNLFYRLSPSWFLYPLIVLATFATVIASQAAISGAFSLARQSVQLGLWPRLQIIHTSPKTIGQVYIPFVNWFLCIGTIILVIAFRHSSNLASAYGIAVSGTMLITTFMMILVVNKIWKIKVRYFILIAILMLASDTIFLISNTMKTLSGGWIVLFIAASIYLLMSTWQHGRQILGRKISDRMMSLDIFMQSITYDPPQRVPGVAIFLSGNPNGIPRAMIHNMKHNKILHEKTVILTILTEEVPYIREEDRISEESYGEGIYRITVRYGFSESPDIPKALQKVTLIKIDPMQTTYFLGRETLILRRDRRMPVWRKKIFRFMSQNSLGAILFYNIPPNLVVELGLQVEL